MIASVALKRKLIKPEVTMYWLKHMIGSAQIRRNSTRGVRLSSFLTLKFTMNKKALSYGDDIANYGDINLSIDYQV
jgi:hypothetical protein